MPSGRPTSHPTPIPSAQTSPQPSNRHSIAPVPQPSSQPSGKPSSQPSFILSPPTSLQPSPRPIDIPTSRLSYQPTTHLPSSHPTSQPTPIRSAQTSPQPSNRQSSNPSSRPSSQPSQRKLTHSPSSQTSFQPTLQPYLTLTWAPSPVICLTNSTADQYFASVRPNITHIYQSGGGDASGGEILNIYGYHLGTNISEFGVAINDLYAWSICRDVVLRQSADYNPAHNAGGRHEAYIECRTAPMTVGDKNVTIFVDSLKSQPFSHYSVSCKAGHYGGVGEFCTSCTRNVSSLGSVANGLSCPADKMIDPIAAPGK